MIIRRFHAGDEAALAAIMHSSVHELAKKNYTPEQLEAWAPQEYDELQWGERVRRLQPFVADVEGSAVGYADLQPTGYIDHFFVAGSHAGRGVGNALMETIHRDARQRRLHELFADVSLTAEAFFSKHGFSIEARNLVTVRGVQLPNARMRKRLADQTGTRGT